MAERRAQPLRCSRARRYQSVCDLLTRIANMLRILLLPIPLFWLTGAEFPLNYNTVFASAGLCAQICAEWANANCLNSFSCEQPNPASCLCATANGHSSFYNEQLPQCSMVNTENSCGDEADLSTASQIYRLPRKSLRLIAVRMDMAQVEEVLESLASRRRRQRLPVSTPSLPSFINICLHARKPLLRLRIYSLRQVPLPRPPPAPLPRSVG